ncbi:MAG: group 1 truncated hemoglobin [Nostoc sp. S4]|nr:group 1 truncated hemoglobin [Nostoc sp. S4]
MSATLYDKLGGKPTVEKIVDDLHKRILADNTLNHFFANTDMAKQRAHQIAFFSLIFEGPKEYTGRPMDKTHTGMNLQQQHFDAIAKHLSEAMAVSGASAEDTNAALERVSSFKPAILNK